MKLLILFISVFLMSSLQAQDDDLAKKYPTKWYKEEIAKRAKAYIEQEDMITYYRCSTGEVPYSIEKPKVKIKTSLAGEPFVDVIVIGKDQTGEKKSRKIFLDDIWVKLSDGTYSNMADDLGVGRPECNNEALNDYFDAK